MSSPAPSPLRQLDWLDRSSPEFLHQLDDVLHGQEYKQRVQNLQIEDSGLLVNYLDEVCRVILVLLFYSLTFLS